MKSCTVYTEEFISRFVDKELPSGDRETFTRHMAGCSRCRAREAAFRNLTFGVNRHLTAQAVKIQNELPPITPVREQKTAPRRSGFFTLKLASLATAAMVMAAALFPWSGPTPIEPSAIVNSVDTAGSSVMIIDTPDTRHTIIWFSET